MNRLLGLILFLSSFYTNAQIAVIQNNTKQTLARLITTRVLIKDTSKSSINQVEVTSNQINETTINYLETEQYIAFKKMISNMTKSKEVNVFYGDDLSFKMPLTLNEIFKFSKVESVEVLQNVLAKLIEEKKIYFLRHVTLNEYF